MVNSLINKYEPISLEQMKSIRLMNRIDTKFVTSTKRLQTLLSMLSGQYYVQETKGLRLIPYYTLYFDTSGLDMYTRHHDGCLVRQKLRVRSYVNSHLSFLEVKSKDNHKRTNKKRVEFTGFDPELPRHDIRLGIDADVMQYSKFLTEHLGYDCREMTEQLENHFNRITLVNKEMTERVTIDTSLRFDNVATGRSFDMSDIAIIELKRDGLADSPIVEHLRRLRIFRHGFSKYCIGTALTNPNAKTNQLKERLHSIERIAKLT